MIGEQFWESYVPGINRGITCNREERIDLNQNLKFISYIMKEYEADVGEKVKKTNVNLFSTLTIYTS